MTLISLTLNFNITGELMPATVAQLTDKLNTALDGIDAIKASVALTLTSVTDNSDDLGVIATKIDDLQAALAALSAGSVITQAELDGLLTKAGSLSDSADAAKASIAAVVTAANAAKAKADAAKADISSTPGI